ncbi:hypothetical protein FNV43_RR26276 [Rhamnella rubrinervis]|uniref:Uncharacterized protein n=1 Tax=Rhamnella rubrinervis TaxID=2594499 RepID=A0A8K0GRC1_9ROSA|nr:hypothetical protein FNV43_RR26276 [Rhamnella rubrinervis]
MSLSGRVLHAETTTTTHIALFPSAGMGHLTPFLRLAAFLVHHHCQLTLITINPSVSLAESRFVSRFLSAFPQVAHVQFDLLPFDPSTAKSNDPFFIQFEAIRSSAHLLSPLLASLSPRLSALVYDVSLISSVIPVTESLHLPNYVFFTSSARMFSFFAYFPAIASSSGALDSALLGDALKIPGIAPIPRSSIPPWLLIPNSLFAHMFSEDSPKLTKVNGVLINTFKGLEPEALDALHSRKHNEPEFPPVFGVGPLVPLEFEKEDQYSPAISKWLDEQLDGSVVYVSFGSRTALSRDQIREVGEGLVKSGFRFLWVVKDKKVDKEEDEGVEEVVGKELMELIKEKGLVVKHWVDQGEILGHRAIGGFVNHCGWNSVIEAAWHGVKMLGWPQHGDQKINAEVVEESGLGMWVKSWGWGGVELVNGDEIGEKVREMMESQTLEVKAGRVREEARKAAEIGGIREKMFKELIGKMEQEKF